MESHRVNSIISGRSPPLHCTLTDTSYRQQSRGLYSYSSTVMSDVCQFNSTVNSKKRYKTPHVRTVQVQYCSECVCVCVFSSHPFWTSMDVPAGVTQEKGHTGFLIHLPSAVRALIFVARRIQPFLSLVDREVEFCVLTN